MSKKGKNRTGRTGQGQILKNYAIQGKKFELESVVNDEDIFINK